MEQAICDLYVRVSTAEQVEGFSLGEQEDRLRKYASAHGWIINACIVDAGFSGGSLQRDGIQQVIEDAKKHRINKVVVYKLDRLSRSQKDTMFLIEDVFLKNGVDFCSMTETIDTSTALGMAMIGILSTFAQFERAQIKERMMLGRDALVKTGKYHGNGNHIIGLDYDVPTKTLSINEYEAMIVRELFARLIAGNSITSMVKWFNSINFRGHTWTPEKVTRIFTQPMYIGYQRWKGETYKVENCPLILDEDTWMQAKQELARRDNKTPHPKSVYDHVTLLGGLCWCGKCGRRMFATKTRTDKKYVYYCYSTRASKYKWQGVENCHNKGFRASVLDDIIIEQLSQIRTRMRCGETLDITRPNSLDAEINALQTRLEQLNSSQKRLVDLYAIGSIDIDTIQAKSEEIRKERESIESQIEALKNPDGRLSPTEVIKSLDTFAELIEVAGDDHMELYNVIRNLIESIVITDGNVDIHWNF